MLNETKEIVGQIINSTKEIEAMENQISLISSEKLKEILEVAKHGLEFKGIYKSAYGHNINLDDVKEYYKDKRKKIPKGTLICSLIEDSERSKDGEWEVHSELFLMEDGSLKVFDTYYESKSCSDCNATHVRSFRNVGTNEISSFDVELIIQQVLIQLKKRQSTLEERKGTSNERLEKLRTIRIS